MTFVCRFADCHPLKGDTGGSAAEACPECFSVYEPVLGEHRAQHSGGGGEIREDGNSVNFVSASVAACWVHTLSVACVQHRSQSSSRLAHSPLFPTAGRTVQSRPAVSAQCLHQQSPSIFSSTSSSFFDQADQFPFLPFVTWSSPVALTTTGFHLCDLDSHTWHEDLHIETDSST